MTAYYNEIDPFAAEWLENLILIGAIAPGVVDRRSIEDVAPSDLKEFTQCHFFAGIGVWSHALRAAGWPDDRPVWTGSCPCQPFSQAGQGGGLEDDRHLWPALHHLAVLCGPSVLFGEQVSSKDGLAWLDLVHTDMEATGYAFGALDLCAAGVGAPHIRQRTFWMAYANDQQSRERRELAVQRGRENDAQQIRLGVGTNRLADSPGSRFAEFSGRRFEPSGGPEGGASRVVGNPHDARLPEQRRDGRVSCESGGTDARKSTERTDAPSCGLADPNGGDASPERQQRFVTNAVVARDEFRGPGPTNGFWGNADWLACRDGKWRPVEPGTFPLAHGVANRVGALRGYGNAIIGPLAKEFIEIGAEYLGY